MYVSVMYVCEHICSQAHHICFMIGREKSDAWIMVKKYLLLDDTDAIKISMTILYAASCDFF